MRPYLVTLAGAMVVAGIAAWTAEASGQGTPMASTRSEPIGGTATGSEEADTPPSVSFSRGSWSMGVLTGALLDLDASRVPPSGDLAVHVPARLTLRFDWIVGWRDALTRNTPTATPECRTGWRHPRFTQESIDQAACPRGVVEPVRHAQTDAWYLGAELNLETFPHRRQVVGNVLDDRQRYALGLTAVGGYARRLGDFSRFQVGARAGLRGVSREDTSGWVDARDMMPLHLIVGAEALFAIDSHVAVTGVFEASLGVGGAGGSGDATLLFGLGLRYVMPASDLVTGASLSGANPPRARTASTPTEQTDDTANDPGGDPVAATTMTVTADEDTADENESSAPTR